MPIAIDIFISIDPAFDACSPEYFETATNATQSASNKAIVTMPLVISPTLSPLISLIVKAIMPIATAIFISIEPASCTSPLNVEIHLAYAVNKIPTAPSVVTPLIQSSGDRPEIIFIAIAMIARETAIFMNVFPAESILAASTLLLPKTVAINVINIAIPESTAAAVVIDV